MFISKTPLLLKSLYPGLTWNESRKEKCIYLTFDDGPIPIVTPFVLKTLKNFNARATFFCIGDNVRKHPEIYKDVLAEGHAVGNHTFHHLNGWKTDDETYLTDFEKCSEFVNSHLFRPPYGRIRRSQIKKLESYRTEKVEGLGLEVEGREIKSPKSKIENLKTQDSRLNTPDSQLSTPNSQLKIIMWDVLSGDFEPDLKPEDCLENVIKYTQNGSIVVFHDSLKAQERLEYALPRALAYWTKKGYQFKTW